jgi:FMN reductase
MTDRLTPLRRRTIVVVQAGLGQPSSTKLLGERLASATAGFLLEAGVTPETSTVELRDHAQDLTSNLLTGFPSPALQAAIDAVLAADGLIAVTPVYSGSYSGLFKTFFDVLQRDALADRPVLLAATAGTARHSLAIDHAMRPLFAYLGAAVVPTGVFAAAEDWGAAEAPMETPLAERIERAGRELAAAVLSAEPRSGRPPTDPYADPVPFEELLRAD